ncbi:MAG TPA: sialidase family protein, partial [Actinomycetota bacterium]|nr:sialidase family protein [Actinomycetota bacterium]
MRIRLIPISSAMLVLALLGAPARAATNAKVTADDTAGSYLRYDGQSDATMAACSTGRRSQNEPSVAVDPRNPQVVVSGANDYCAAIVNGDVWAGYYRSTDGGSTWNDSLVPGYVDDTSEGGLASPAHGSCGAAGDPTQAFDTEGRLFYGFICFNRTKPINGSLYVATYDADGANYVRTALVAKGTPSGLFGVGVLQDKDNLAVDQTDGPNAGNVYMAWARFTADNPNNFIQFSRSTDHGATFSHPIKISTPKEGGTQFADVAVGPDGTVYVVYQTFQTNPQRSTGVSIVQST